MVPILDMVRNLIFPALEQLVNLAYSKRHGYAEPTYEKPTTPQSDRGLGK